MPEAEEIHPTFFRLRGRDEKYANNNDEQGKLTEVSCPFWGPLPTWKSADHFNFLLGLQSSVLAMWLQLQDTQHPYLMA